MEQSKPDPHCSNAPARMTADSAPMGLSARRAEYARRILEQAGIDAETASGHRIGSAFAAIPRELFLGAPPWRIVSPSTHAQKTSNEPADLYDDVLVALGAGKGLNNGQPSLHAACLRTLAPGAGECAVHVGAGTGYYSAILAMLLGPGGRLDAYEIEPELAAQAADRLAGFPHVEVHARSGAIAPLPDCDVLYVNAAAPEPLAVWLDALKPKGRLLFPLAPGAGPGEMLLVARTSAGYAARFLGGVEFVSCMGTQNREAGGRLWRAFRRGGWKEVKSLHRNESPDASCWLAGRDWWLSTRD